MEDDFKHVQEERRKKAKLEPKKYPSSKPTTDLIFKPRPQNQGMLPRTGGGNPRNLIICHSCGAKGHYSNECQKPRIICFGCNQEGHMKSQCQIKQHGEGSQLEADPIEVETQEAMALERDLDHSGN
jgi:hypothetical protein